MSRWFKKLNRLMLPSADQPLSPPRVPLSVWLRTHPLSAACCVLGLVLCGISVWWIHNSATRESLVDDAYTTALDSLIETIDAPNPEAEVTASPRVERARSTVSETDDLRPVSDFTTTVPGPELRLPRSVGSVETIRTAAAEVAERKHADRGPYGSGQVRLSRFDAAHTSDADAGVSSMRPETASAAAPAWLSGTIEELIRVPAAPGSGQWLADGPRLMISPPPRPEPADVPADLAETPQNRR